MVIDEPNVQDQASGGYAQIISRKIMMEILPYLNIYQTEEITQEQLDTLEMTMEEAEAGRKLETDQTPETDEYGNVIETQETDENGNPVQDDSWNLGDEENPVVENPNIVSPPENNGENVETEESEAGVTNEDLNIP